MPIPKPKKKESREDFIDRCMGDSVMNDEYPNESQRLAICSSQWRKRNESKTSK